MFLLIMRLAKSSRRCSRPLTGRWLCPKKGWYAALPDEVEVEFGVKESGTINQFVDTVDPRAKAGASNRARHINDSKVVIGM